MFAKKVVESHSSESVGSENSNVNFSPSKRLKPHECANYLRNHLGLSATL